MKYFLRHVEKLFLFGGISPEKKRADLKCGNRIQRKRQIRIKFHYFAFIADDIRRFVREIVKSGRSQSFEVQRTRATRRLDPSVSNNSSAIRLVFTFMVKLIYVPVTIRNER